MALALVMLLATLAGAPALPAVGATAPVYGEGDVFLSVNGSTSYKEFSPQGAPVRRIPLPDLYGGAGVFTLDDHLLVGTFFGPIDEFDAQGDYVGVFADTSQDGLPGGPQAFTIDALGHVFLAAFSYDINSDFADVIREYDADGTLVDHFTVATTDSEVADVDLAADQCTLYYRSGHELLTYDVCTHTQGPVITDALANPEAGIALVPRSDGEILATDYDDGVLLLDADGQVLRTYHPKPDYSDDFTQVELAPDGTSFWTIDANSATVFHIRISDGRLLRRFRVHSTASGSGDRLVGSLAVFGEPSVGRTTASVR